MPRGNYSYPGQDEQRPVGISEPSQSWGGSREHPVTAKEPDRQSTTRRGSQSSRSRGAMAADFESESQPRTRASQGTQRGQRAASRRGTQARRAGERTSGTTRRSPAGEAKTGRQKKSRRGFAAMSPEQQREIARKGGLTVSRNRRHMADIGRVGGEHSHGGRRARR